MSAEDFAGPDAQVGAAAGTSGALDAIRGRRLEIWASAIVVALDQMTKSAVREWIPLHGTVPVIPGFLDLTYLHNTGAAFGFLNASDFAFKPLVIAAIATTALLAIAFYALQLKPDEWLARLGLGLILGGAVGNLIDRLAFGYVVDFVDAYWRGYHFWAFNVADAAITCGAVLVIADMLGLGRNVSKAV
jgi:signal peptidase II